MQIVAVELIARLRDAVEAVSAHVAELDDFNLRALERRLPADAPAGSAEMVTLVLIYRELEKRR